MTCNNCQQPIDAETCAEVGGREVCWPCSYKLVAQMFPAPNKAHEARCNKTIGGIMKQRKLLTGLDCLPGQLGMFSGS